MRKFYWLGCLHALIIIYLTTPLKAGTKPQLSRGGNKTATFNTRLIEKSVVNTSSQIEHRKLATLYIDGVSNEFKLFHKPINNSEASLSNPALPFSDNCSYSEGQFLLSWYGEQIYAHYYNGVLYASYQDPNQGFKPRSWLTDAGYDASKLACFATSDPHSTSNPNPNPNPNPNSVPIPAAGSNFAGSFDYADCTLIRGWVMNLNKKNQSTRVDIYVNGWIVATNVMAVKSRQDVADAYGTGGNKAFGFEIPLPPGYRRGVDLTIAVKYAGTSTNLPGSPKTAGVCNNFQNNIDIDWGCDGIARLIPGSKDILTTTLARTGIQSLKLGVNSAGRPSVVTSQLIPIKQGDQFTINGYAAVLAPSERNLKPQLAKAVVGGVLTGLVLTKNQSNQPDQHRLSEVLPTLGVSSALTLPLIKSLLTNRWPNATLELAFYDKQGHFESRQQVGLSKMGYGDWQQLHIEGRATQDGYVKFRLQNHSKLPVYWDDMTFQVNTTSPDNVSISEAVVGKRSSTGGFPASVSTASQEIYRTGNPCNTWGPNDGLLTDTWFRDPLNGILLSNVDVTADAPTYSLGQNNTIVYTEPITGSTFPATASSDGSPGSDIADITFVFNQKLEESKNHFCQQAATIRAGYPSGTPNWAAPGDPQSGLVARLLKAFADDVKNNAPYDLKTQGYGPQNIGLVSAYNGSVYNFDAYGNINYGLAAAASGIPLSIAVCSAGIYQIGSSTGPVDFSNLSGCLDNSVDSAMIRMGYQMFIGCENGVRTNNAEQN